MSTKISGMATYSSPVLASDYFPVLHMPGGVPDATGPQRATLSQIRAAFMPIALASDVSGTLPVASIAPSGTNGWVLTTVAGVPVWQAPTAGGASAGGSGQVQTSDGAGGFTAPTNVLAGANFLSIGATPSASGLIRVPYSVSAVVMAQRDNVNGADWPIITTTSAATIFGDTTNNQNTYLRGFQLQIIANSSGDIDMFTGANFGLHVTPTSLAAAQPIIGDSRATAPYGVHAVQAQAMADANQTASATVYSAGTIKTTGAITANRTLTVPAASATDSLGYYKFICNTCTGAFGIIISTGAGTTVTIANGKSACVLIDSRGVTRLTPDT